MSDRFGSPQLVGTFYTDETYSQNHAHMVHKHEKVLELLYIASGEGRYQVGHREYAVHAGNLIICNGNTLHGEAPFQQHTMQTYCIALAGVQLQDLSPHCMIQSQQRPVLELTESNEVIRHLMQTVHALFSEKPRDTELCQTLAMSIFLLVFRELTRLVESGRTAAEQKAEQLVRQISEYLDQNYMRPITLAEIDRKSVV